MCESIQSIALTGPADPFLRLFDAAERIQKWGLDELDSKSDEVRLAYYFLARLAEEIGYQLFHPSNDHSDFGEAVELAVTNILEDQIFFLNNQYCEVVEEMIQSNKRQSE